MSADQPERCRHHLVAGSCLFCRRGLPAAPESQPETVPDAERVVEHDDNDRDLPWWHRRSLTGAHSVLYSEVRAHRVKQANHRVVRSLHVVAWLVRIGDGLGGFPRHRRHFARRDQRQFGDSNS
jgi:hypothetical protein